MSKCPACEEWERSFDLYDKASLALMLAYKRAHPDIPDHVWPDATTVNVWAAHMIDSLNTAQEQKR